MKLKDFETRIRHLIELGTAVLQTETSSDDGFSFVDVRQFQSFRTESLSFLINVFGPKHTYSLEFDRSVDKSRPYVVEAGLGILEAARREMADGWARTTHGLVTAEIFSDFLEMASYLLSENYKDAAAVIIGGVLEEHLRQLCIANGLAFNVTDASGRARPKKAESLNTALAAAGVYSKGDQKNVTAWYDLRSNAAHGDYGKYTQQQVELLLQSVRDFITRFPA